MDEIEKCLKEKYLEARDKNVDNTTFTYEQLSALQAMAKANVLPDWRFGDTECDAWTLFRMMRVG